MQLSSSLVDRDSSQGRVKVLQNQNHLSTELMSEKQGTNNMQPSVLGVQIQDSNTRHSDGEETRQTASAKMIVESIEEGSEKMAVISEATRPVTRGVIP